MTKALTKSLLSVIIPGLFLATHLHAQSRPLTLHDAVAEAQSNNPDVQQKRYGMAQTNWAYREISAANLPSIHLNSMAGRVGEAPSVLANLQGEEVAIQLGSTYSFRTRLEVQQKIFDFGQTASRLEASRYAYNTQHASYNRELLRVAVHTKEQYYRVLHYSRLDSLYGSIVDLRDELERISSTQFEEGVVLEPAFLRTRAEVQLAAARQAEAQGEIAKGSMTLARLMGRVHPDFELVSPLPSPAEFVLPEDTIETLYTRALEHRSDVRQLQYSAREQAALTRAIKTRRRPTVIAQADLTYYGPKSLFGEYSSYGGQGLQSYNWRVGVAIEYALFDGFKTRAQREQAAITTSRIEKQVQQLKLDIRSDLEITVNDLERLQLVYESNALFYAATQSNLALGEVKYNHGALPLIAFLQLKIDEVNSTILLEKQLYEMTRLILLLESIVEQEIPSTPLITME